LVKETIILEILRQKIAFLGIKTTMKKWRSIKCSLPKTFIKISTKRRI